MIFCFEFLQFNESLGVFKVMDFFATQKSHNMSPVNNLINSLIWQRLFSEIDDFIFCFILRPRSSRLFMRTNPIIKLMLHNTDESYQAIF